MKKKTITSLIFLFLVIAIAKFFMGKTSSHDKKNYQIINKDNKKIIANKNIPANPNFKLILEKDYTINYEEIIKQQKDFQFLFPFDLNTDSYDNLYILDVKGGNIGVFNKFGEYLHSIGKFGTGPGEFKNLNSLAIKEDTLYVNDEISHKISTFALSKDSAHFIKTISCSHLQFIKGAGNRFLAYNQKMTEENNNLTNKVVLLNNKFERLKTIIQYDFSMKKLKTPGFNFLKIVPIFTMNKNNIFYAAYSETEYSIKVFDLEGNPLYQIKKSYSKISIDKHEQEEFNKIMQAMSNNHAVNASYKQSITGLYLDSQNRLWVKNAINRSRDKTDKSAYFDIFQDGIFINRVHFPEMEVSDNFDLQRKFLISGEKLYYMDNSKQRLDVYNIKKSTQK